MEGGAVRTSNVERRTLNVEVGLKILLAGLVMMCAACGREVNLSWLANPDLVDGYRVYRGIDLLASTTETKAIVQADTGDVVSLVAWRDIQVSDAAALTIPAPVLDGAAVHGFSSQETVNESAPASAAVDGNPQTFWHSMWHQSPGALAPHYIALVLPRVALVSGLYYLPRQDGGENGHVLTWQAESSMDGLTWEPWAEGTWANNAQAKHADLPLRQARYLRLWGYDRRMAAAAVKVRGTYAPESGSIRMTLQASGNLTDWTDLETWTREIPRTGFYRVKTEVQP
jgi:hypothetical protein